MSCDVTLYPVWCILWTSDTSTNIGLCLAIFARPNGHRFVSFPTQLWTAPPIPSTLHQKPVAALYLHNCDWQTNNPRHPTAAYRRLQRVYVLVFMRVFYFLWKDGSERGVCLTTSWAADITLPALERVRCVHLDITFTTFHRWASDNRRDFLSINRN